MHIATHDRPAPHDRRRDHVRESAAQLAACIRHLERDGYHVIEGFVTDRLPRVHIANHPRTSRLNGAVRMRRYHPARGHERVFAAVVLGCQVEWVVWGH